MRLALILKLLALAQEYGGPLLKSLKDIIDRLSTSASPSHQLNAQSNEEELAMGLLRKLLSEDSKSTSKEK